MSRLDGIATGCGIVLLVLAAYTAITVKNMSERPEPQPPRPAPVVIGSIRTPLANGREILTYQFEGQEWSKVLEIHAHKELESGVPR